MRASPLQSPYLIAVTVAPCTAVFVEVTPQVSSADREALLTTVVTAMDEMAASTKAAEKRAIEAEQRVLELETANGNRRH
jgi:hypothetical protein